MAQGKKPSFRISFRPEGENASWREIGALWSTKNDKIHTGEIFLLPLEALATGKLSVAIQAIEPNEE